jgi:hypothetical protein
LSRTNKKGLEETWKIDDAAIWHNDPQQHVPWKSFFF